VTEGAFGRLYDEGVILRTHVLRPTWHFVLPDDIRWLVEVTAPRARRTLEQHQRDLGIDDRALGESEDVIVEALSAGVHRTREELADRLGAAGLPAKGLALGMLLYHAELSALICSGARRQDGRHTYALLDERAPGARRLDRDEALAELVLRYFTGHGPATERDLAYWATMTLTDVRAGLASVKGQLEGLEHDGRTYWFAEPPPPDGPVEPHGHLLQTLDEYHNGYQDSRYVLDAEGIVPRGRAAAVGMALVDGQMVGDMRRTVKPGSVRFDVRLFRLLTGDESDALHEAADRYGQFLDLEPALVMTER
jgi:hypothetical protein